ncbi:(2Fe-2S)-binding protein [Tropicimonas sp. IMCC34011]|uniref:(2Fe-2S)-binding protein n=1 Tax=Tropicimonas sp. IMCC34011 TaxID=2248759 RepID=UPI000E28968D|nr:(2Fe-2S)-binding protein [Tropicimonas sp. IMCC34011]
MATEPYFVIPAKPGSSTVTITFEGRKIVVPAGISVAAALLAGGVGVFRTSIVSAAPRAPFCMMGVCFECLVEIDGISGRQSCMVPVTDGMAIRRQEGSSALDVSEGAKDDV